jgi:hypothetical protein
MEVSAMHTVTRTTFAVLPFPLLLAALLYPAPSLERGQLSGTHRFSVVQSQQIESSDAPGHVLMLAQAKGSNQSAGPAGFMDGAEIASASMADLVAGNGSNHGYDVQVSGGDTVFTKWTGVVTTVLSPEKIPLTSLRGTWTKNRGTGRYAGIKGSGTYQGRFTSPTEYVVEWNGEITVPRDGIAKR